MLVINLPMPPTANNLFPTAKKSGRRYKSKQYKAWIVSAGFEIWRQKPQPILGKVTIDIAVSTKARGDCANREKATTDLLVKHCVIQGDSKKYVQSVSTHWAKDVEGVRVTIRSVEDDVSDFKQVMDRIPR